MIRAARLALRLALIAGSLASGAPAFAATDASGPIGDVVCGSRSPAIVPVFTGLDAEGDVIVTRRCAVADDLHWRALLGTSLRHPRRR